MPEIFAHRLGRAYSPDSSRQALRRSLSQPLDGLETDCCLTADGQLVLLHDPLLALGTTISGFAHKRTAAQILGGRLLDHHGHATSARSSAIKARCARSIRSLPTASYSS